jgi:hypothetical protein
VLIAATTPDELALFGEGEAFGDDLERQLTYLGEGVVVQKRVAIVAVLDSDQDGRDLGVGRCWIHERLLGLRRPEAPDR